MERTKRFISVGFLVGMIMGASVLSSAQVTNKKTFSPSSFQNQYAPLSIGDKVPDFEFSLVNSSGNYKKFSDFKGKYVIIDFWATWCTSCLHHFPQLDSIQKQFDDSLQIVLANEKSTRDNQEKVTSFFNKRKNKNGLRYKLPSIVMDTVLNILFPHKLIPHYIWIDGEGAVKNITGSEAITKENVQAFINGEALQLKEKKDLSFDISKPLFINGNGGTNEKYIFRSFLTGYMDGLPGSGGVNKNAVENIDRIFITNASILTIYRQAYPEMGKYSENQIILDVSDRSIYTDNNNWDTWKYEHAYCYELILPPTTMDAARKMMQQDLYRYFKLNVRLEKKIVNCWVLKNFNSTILSKNLIGDSKTNLYDEDNLPKYMHNRPISYFIGALNHFLNLPVIDGTEIKVKVNIERLPTDLSNIQLLNMALNKIGLTLVNEQREIEFFILSERKD